MIRLQLNGNQFRLPAERIDEGEAFLRTYEVVAKPHAMDRVVVRDPADRWVLANARTATADILVTGDADLLAVAATAGLRIMTPREFWTELRRGAR